MREITVIGERVLSPDEAKHIRAEISDRFRARQDRESQIRAMSRRPTRGETESLRFAMRAVEQRIVRGLWVLEISQTADGPRQQRLHGIGYLYDGSDVDARYTDAAGKKWDAPPPRPAVPSSREIDAAKEAQAWIEWLEEDQARLLTLAAMSKRGERSNRVSWERVKARLRLPDDFPMRTLQDRYDRGLRTIVAELTLRRIG